MFSKLSPKTKKIVINCIIIASLLVIGIGFYTGKKVEEREKAMQEELEDQQTLEGQQRGGYSVSELEEQRKEKEQEELKTRMEEMGEEPFDDMHGEYEYLDDPKADFDENAEVEISVLEDIFTKEEIEQASETAESFVRAFYGFDGDNPTKHMENAKKYVTETLYQEISRAIPRPLDNYYKTEVKEVEVYEPYQPSNEEKMVLIARVVGEVFDFEGKTVKEETSEYHMLFELEDNEYKVDKYHIANVH